MASPIKTYSELKEFWMIHRPTDPATGDKVLSYRVKTHYSPSRSGNQERSLRARLLDAKTGLVYTKFFLYIEDAFYNANLILSREVPNDQDC